MLDTVRGDSGGLDDSLELCNRNYNLSSQLIFEDIALNIHDHTRNCLHNSGVSCVIATSSAGYHVRHIRCLCIESMLYILIFSK